MESGRLKIAPTMNVVSASLTRESTQLNKTEEYLSHFSAWQEWESNLSKIVRKYTFVQEE